ncbi:MAG: acetyl-CoA acetyltransferase [Candidatus Hermodarchaeota archaeon]
MSKKIHPIVIGVAQYTQSKNETKRLDPLSLMVKTCQKAINDTGSNAIKNYIDAIYMVNINSWSYKDAPGELSKLIGISPSQKVYLPDGGDSPQMLVNRAAKAISKGKKKAILITGAEAAYSTYLFKKGKTKLNWPKRRQPEYMEGPLWFGTTEFENTYGFYIPSYSYAMFETALRASSGRTIKEHKKYMGKIFERYSKIASKNSYAWNSEFYSAEEITTPSPENRKVLHPYTKRMCANMFVDQTGALIVTSEQLARTLNINSKKWVYLMGGSDFKNIFNIAQRPKLHNSPAAREGSKLALKQAGLTLEDIDKFDIYSCFPSAVQIISNEIGLKMDNPRDLTVTGGLPYFGAPWSNYSTHAIITTVEIIRKNPSLKIMVIANGGYNTKQSFGIYGKEPSVEAWVDRDDSKIQESILAKKLPEPVKEANGQITVEAYTIPYNRNGEPEKVIVLGHLENDQRTLAFIEGKAEDLVKLASQELVGQSFAVHYDSKRECNLIILK